MPTKQDATPAAAVEGATEDQAGNDKGKDDKEPPPKKRAKRVDDVLLAAFRYFDRTGEQHGSLDAKLCHLRRWR